MLIRHVNTGWRNELCAQFFGICASFVVTDVEADQRIFQSIFLLALKKGNHT
jgi:hypothetical protein